VPLISEFWSLLLASKDAPLFKDAEFATAWKKRAIQVTGFLH